MGLGFCMKSMGGTLLMPSVAVGAYRLYSSGTKWRRLENSSTWGAVQGNTGEGDYGMIHNGLQLSQGAHSYHPHDCIGSAWWVD